MLRTYLNRPEMDHLINVANELLTRKNTALWFCEDCKGTITLESGNIAGSIYFIENKNVLICNACYDNYGNCNNCNQHFHNENDEYVSGIFLENGYDSYNMTLCMSCYDSDYNFCYKCERYSNHETMQQAFYGIMCLPCYDGLTQCPCCTQSFPFKEMVFKSKKVDYSPFLSVHCINNTEFQVHTCPHCSTHFVGDKQELLNMREPLLNHPIQGVSTPSSLCDICLANNYWCTGCSIWRLNAGGTYRISDDGKICCTQCLSQCIECNRMLPNVDKITHQCQYCIAYKKYLLEMEEGNNQ